MANVKNSDRRKRKYGDRAPKTAANKVRRLTKHENRIARLKMRSESLVGKNVEVRTSYGKIVGTVQSITTAPEASIRRNGTFLVVSNQGTPVTVSRHRVKPV